MKDLSWFNPAKSGFRFIPHAHRDNSCQPGLRHGRAQSKAVHSTGHSSNYTFTAFPHPALAVQKGMNIITITAKFKG